MWSAGAAASRAPHATHRKSIDGVPPASGSSRLPQRQHASSRKHPSVKQTTSTENRQPRRKCAAAPRPRQTGQYCTMGFDRSRRIRFRTRSPCRSRACWTRVDRIGGSKRRIRTHGSAQQVLRRLSRQEGKARNSGVVNVAIDVRKMDAHCVLNETSGRGTQCACGPPKPTGQQLAGQDLWANGPQRGTVQGWQDLHHQRAAVVGWCDVPFRSPESRRVPLERSQRPAE